MGNFNYNNIKQLLLLIKANNHKIIFYELFRGKLLDVTATV